MTFTVVKLVAALTLGLVAAPLVPDAQRAGKVLPWEPAPRKVVLELQQALSHARDRFQAMDEAGVLRHVSDHYRTDPLTKAAIREQLRVMFALYDTLRAQVRIDDAWTAGDRAWVFSTGEVSGRLRGLGTWMSIFAWQHEPEVARREKGGWRLYGYQQRPACGPRVRAARAPVLVHLPEGFPRVAGGTRAPTEPVTPPGASREGRTAANEDERGGGERSTLGGGGRAILVGISLAERPGVDPGVLMRPVVLARIAVPGPHDIEQRFTESLPMVGAEVRQIPEELPGLREAPVGRQQEIPLALQVVGHLMDERQDEEPLLHCLVLPAHQDQIGLVATLRRVADVHEGRQDVEALCQLVADFAGTKPQRGAAVEQGRHLPCAPTVRAREPACPRSDRLSMPASHRVTPASTSTLRWGDCGVAG